MTESPDITSTTAYERLGGEPGVRRLVRRFYELMDELPEAYTVRQIHPPELQGAEEGLFEFLSGWLGGPQLYAQRVGHPRLRMRHAPYRIGQVERDEWMLCMRMALDEQVTDLALRQGLVQAFEAMSTHLINTEGGHACGHPP